jgi:2-oxoacid:acceptor oxidoreductase delta subunit (pyruvate/2-ketoisovalerate family)
VGIEMVSLRKLARADGRKARVAFEGTERVLEADMVIPCIGEQVDPAGLGPLVDGSGYLRVNEGGGFENHPRLFAGGDARGDRGTVAAAIADGRRVAQAIRSLLNPGVKNPQPLRREIGFEELNLAYFETAAARRAPTLAPDQRSDQAEIEAGLDMGAALEEAARCFSCGNCLACDNCWNLCPDSAVIKTARAASDGSHYVFDYDYCKGCGLCARECPVGFIAMVEEPL